MKKVDSLLSLCQGEQIFCIYRLHLRRLGHGAVPIERIKVGDKVWARNEKTGATTLRRVTNIAPQHFDQLMELRIEGESVALRATPTHPFRARRDAGDTAHWINAGDLIAGEQIETQGGRWATILSVSALDKPAVVYNFTVEEDHDYFVGEQGLLVHNDYRGTFFDANPGLVGQVQVHHAIEQQVLNNYPDLFTPDEINSLDNLRGIPNGIADELHQSFLRQLWNNFYKQVPPGTATREDFLAERDFIDKMLGKYFKPPCGVVR